METTPVTRTVAQIKGLENAVPDLKFQSQVKDFLNSEPWDVVHEADQMGLEKGIHGKWVTNKEATEEMMQVPEFVEFLNTQTKTPNALNSGKLRKIWNDFVRTTQLEGGIWWTLNKNQELNKKLN